MVMFKRDYYTIEAPKLLKISFNNRNTILKTYISYQLNGVLSLQELIVTTIIITFNIKV